MKDRAYKDFKEISDMLLTMEKLIWTEDNRSDKEKSYVISCQEDLKKNPRKNLRKNLR